MKSERIDDWGDYPSLPDDAEAQVAAFVQSEREKYEGAQYQGFVQIWESDRIQPHEQYPNQVFAVFGSTAYELFSIRMEIETPDDQSPRIFEEYGPVRLERPAVANGVAFRQSPEEGRAGTLHWTWNSKDGWSLSWNRSSGWLHTNELAQTRDQIIANMGAEIDTAHWR